jgi:hypothetical protein
LKKLLHLTFFIFYFLSGSTLFSQDEISSTKDTYTKIIIDGMIIPKPVNKLYDWYIFHSIGVALEESKPVFLVTLSTTSDYRVYYGLKGGVYNHQKDLDKAVNEFLQSLGPFNAGAYEISGNFATTRTPTFVGALYGSYNLNHKFFLNGSFGFQYYTEETYFGELSFEIATSGSPPPNVTITPDASFYISNIKDVIKAYYSLGVDYNTGEYKLGIYGDNLFSFGINIGIGFN